MAGLLTVSAVAPELAAYLLAASRRPFALGVDDCALFVARWIERARGKCLTGAYEELAQGSRTLPPRRMIRAWRSCGRLNGLPETGRALVGDAALVHDAGGLVGAIRTATGWARFGDRRVVVAPARVVVGWAIVPRDVD